MHPYFKFINHYSTFTYSHPLANEFVAGLPVWEKQHYKYYLFTMGERKKITLSLSWEIVSYSAMA